MIRLVVVEVQMQHCGAVSPLGVLIELISRDVAYIAPAWTSRKLGPYKSTINLYGCIFTVKDANIRLSRQRDT